jgi:VIT1/CCC1 family predicted Fe2+/Mn2+ transporter
MATHRPPQGIGSVVPAWLGRSVQRREDRARVTEQAVLREILMGAQDNLTNVLAVMLGVAVGSGERELVALAGAAAAVAEAISMGGVLYSATRANERSQAHDGGTASERSAMLGPVASGSLTFVAALVAGMLPLLPFAILGLEAAVAVSVAISLVALFGLGAWTGRTGGAVWWRDGLRLLVVGSAAAVAAAGVGMLLRVA